MQISGCCKNISHDKPGNFRQNNLWHQAYPSCPIHRYFFTNCCHTQTPTNPGNSCQNKILSTGAFQFYHSLIFLHKYWHSKPGNFRQNKIWSLTDYCSALQVIPLSTITVFESSLELLQNWFVITGKNYLYTSLFWFPHKFPHNIFSAIPVKAATLLINIDVCDIL